MDLNKDDPSAINPTGSNTTGSTDPATANHTNPTTSPRIKFRVDGPKNVENRDFSIYQTLFSEDNPPSFKALCNIALNGSYSWPVRRLALRDLVRRSPYCTADKNSTIAHVPTRHPAFDIPGQSCTNQSRQYYITKDSIYNISDIITVSYPNLNGDQCGPQFTLMLRRQPEFLAILTEELLYALDQGYIPLGDSNRQDCDYFIKFLLPIIDSSRGRRLWHHHSLYTPDETARHQDINRYIEFWHDLQDDPVWLRNSLWSTITSCLPAEIEAHRDILADAHHINDLSDHYDGFRTIFNLSRILEEYRYNIENSYFPHFVELINLMETELPAHLQYLSYETLAVTMPWLKDEQLALKVCRRHFQGNRLEAFRRLRLHDATQFLYWLRGLVTAYDPDDSKLIYRIDKRLKFAHKNPHLFSRDSRKIADTKQPAAP